MLTESGWQGGAGYTPQQVAEMTPDQIYFRVCDKVMLERKVGGRVREISPSGAAQLADEEGKIWGVAADGTRFKAKIGGKSLARRLMEEEAAKRAEEKRKARNARRT